MTSGATPELVQFVERAEQITKKVVQCLQSNTSFEEQLESEPIPVYIKSADSRVLFSNRAYRMVFSPNSMPVGRFGEAFLHETVIPISKASDALVLAGCTNTVFDHVGYDSYGHSVLFRTAKYSLLSIGHPSFSILGITKIQKVLADDEQGMTKMALLTDKWNRFMGLDSSDRDIAILLARGLSTSDIATRLDISKRTVENHRTSILESMAVEAPLDLIKLLVRLQEKGFGDLGV